MIALYIAPLYLVLLIFELIRQIKYFKRHPQSKVIKTTLLVIVLIVFSLSIPIAYFLPVGTAKTIITKFSNYWLGVSLYLFIGVLILDLLHLIYRLISKKKYNEVVAYNVTNIIVIIFALTMSIYGIYNAHNLHTTSYTVKTEKSSGVDSLNVCLIADLHLGYNVGTKEITDMVNKINKINPDIVVLTGDIFDNEYSAIDNPDRILELLNSIKTRYGKFAVYGNHDIEEKVLCGFSFSYKNPSEVSASQEMNDFIKNAGFTLLYDNGISINDENGKFITYIYGRPDAKKFNLGNSERIAAKDISKGYDHDKYFICLDHQPGELKELQEAGVDLDLSGHTHKGQMWPGTISINWFWDNAYGMLNLDNMTSIVTSGVGLFGPNMRIDSIAEIVQISILFNNEN